MSSILFYQGDYSAATKVNFERQEVGGKDSNKKLSTWRV